MLEGIPCSGLLQLFMIRKPDLVLKVSANDVILWISVALSQACSLLKGRYRSVREHSHNGDHLLHQSDEPSLDQLYAETRRLRPKPVARSQDTTVSYSLFLKKRAYVAPLYLGDWLAVQPCNCSIL